MTMLMLSDDLKRNIFLHLPVDDVFTLLSTCTDLHRIGCESSILWNILLKRDDPNRLESCSSKEEPRPSQRQPQKKSPVSPRVGQELYIQSSHVTSLSRVSWKSLVHVPSTPERREGHLMTKLNGCAIVTGGFSADEKVYSLYVSGKRKSGSTIDGWTSIKPKIQGNSPPCVYGATLTAISDSCAVRFGGFRGGGFTQECSSLYLLKHTRCSSSKKNGIEEQCEWIDINDMVQGPIPEPRAYHTATLVGHRYLVIIGGMRTGTLSTSLSEAILDVKTWTWLSETICHPKVKGGLNPSGRHGLTVVLHERNDRLVLFGGGSGDDIMRPWKNNSEVWELSMGKNWEEDLPNSLPWKWNLIHGSAGKEMPPPNDASNYSMDSANSSLLANEKTNILSSDEKNCLACFHVGSRVSSDTVIFFSGGVCSSIILGYDLVRNAWKRPIVQGNNPFPRFAAAATIIDDWLIIHGGYSLSVGRMGDLLVLDLCPAMKRKFRALPQNKLIKQICSSQW